MSGCAWVTLATNDTYCLGALVLAHSLKRVSTRHQLAIIITPAVSPSMREQLSKVFDVVQLVDVLDSQDATNLALLQRPDLGVTFTKIHCWTLTQYSKCVFLDADTLVMQNCDELMEREELSAAPDPGWPDCFNSGVFVFAPNVETFKQLVQFAATHGSFDGGDQGLLNMYFNDWPTSDIRKHLSFLYNMCSTSTYTYLPALAYYGANIKIVHFIGANKPWLLGQSGAGMSSFTQAWWDTFQSSVVQNLNKDMTGLAGALGSKEKSIIEEQWRKQNWEQGNIDFTGKDSFENIWQKIMEAVNKPKVETTTQAQQKESKSVPLIPKEIASQAIPEKEKADIATPTEPLKDCEIPQEPIKEGEEIKQVVATPLAATPPTELPKQEQMPSTPLPAVEIPKSDQPIPMLPPTPEKEQAQQKLDEPSKTPVQGGALPSLPPLPSEIKMQETMPQTPSDHSKPSESLLSSEQAKDKQVVPMEVPITPQAPVGLLPLIGEIPKIEETLKGLEQQLIEQLKDEKKDSVASSDKPGKEPAKATEAPVEQKKSEESQSLPPLPALPPESPKQGVLTEKESKPETTVPEVTKPDTPVTEAPKADVSKEQIAQSEAPKPEEPKPLPETPKAGVPLTDSSKPDVPKAEATKQDAPKAEAAKPDASKTEATKPDEPKADTPKADAPKAVAPKPEEPKTDVAKPDSPKAEAPKLDEAKPESPKSEIKADLPVSEVPKASAEVPKAEVPSSEAQKAEVAQPPPTDTQSQALPSVPVSAQEAAKDSKDSSVQPDIDSKKQKTSKDQKSAKQQAPQPPPKNGKQKKGQPEPTSAHPLAEEPPQTEAAPAKEEQKLPQEPLTPPMSPDSTATKTAESLIQPSTPTITGPTPPVSPMDAPKAEDPLSAQLKESEQAQPTGASSSGPVDPPVPPKRKGKGNGQPQKPQSNGGKGKGKK